MCGIVRRPTRRKDLDPAKFLNLPASAVWKIITVCEDVHIPHTATSLVLHFANVMASKKDFTIEVIPFALYENGMRIVSDESAEAEAAVMHLAMAGSVRRIINDELGKVGLVLELGHCCDIEMWEKTDQETAMRISHDWNVWRADKLRSLPLGAETRVSHEEFLAQGTMFKEKLISMMKELSEAA